MESNGLCLFVVVGLDVLNSLYLLCLKLHNCSCSHRVHNSKKMLLASVYFFMKLRFLTPSEFKLKPIIFSLDLIK